METIYLLLVPLYKNYSVMWNYVILQCNNVFQNGFGLKYKGKINISH